MRYHAGLPDDSVNVSEPHPLREFALLVGGIVGVALGFVLLAVFAVDLLVPRLPAGLEARIFAAGWLASTAESEEPDPAEAALQELVDRLALHWPENPYRLRVFVMEEESPNAFALPGGWIGITEGLLDAVESENELAFVLGHEIGHFAGRDHLRGLGRGVALGLVMTALTASGAGTAADLASLASTFTQRSFDRDQESDADAFGMELVAKEYGHVGGATAFFRRGSDASAVVGEKLAAYLSTHPLDQERIEAMQALTRERGWTENRTLVALP